MESYLNSSQELSLLQPVGFCQYVTSDGFALHSPALASLNLSGEYQGCRIEKGDVTLTDSFRWVSPMMQFHNVLVFLGISPLGKSSLHFLYGEPWCYKACLVRRLLVDHRAEIAISRRQVATVVVEELQAVSYPLARVLGFVAGALLPRRGWQVT